MGIKGLSKLLKIKCADCVTARTLADYSGKIIGLDASGIMYQTAATPLTGPHGRRTDHLVGMFYRTVSFLEAGIIPVYVFDGPSRAAKQQTVVKRKTSRAASGISIAPEAAADCMQMLALMGVPYMVAPAEADALLASLCSRGIIYAVASEDSDMLAFGATKMLRHFSPAGPISEYDLPSILRTLGVTYDQFLSACIILGSDYGNPFRGIGPAKVIDVVRAHPDLASIGEKMNVPAASWEYIRAEFTSHPIGDAIPPPRTSASPALADFLITVHGLSAERVRSAIARM
jgi:flap endonuclease-1